MIGANVQSRITGNITATATLTTNIMDNGEQVLQSTLRITATVDSMVTCNNISGDIGSIEFSISGTLCTYMYMYMYSADHKQFTCM